MLKISLVKEGLFDPALLRAWRAEKEKQIHAGVVAGLKEAGKAIAPKVQAQVASALKIKRRGFLKSYGWKIYDDNPSKLPSLYVGTKVPWSGMQEHGGTAGGGRGLLIPLLDTRIGYSKFKQVISSIVRSGAGFFKTMADGRVILFAEWQPEYGAPLARFKQNLRRSRGGVSVRRGEEIPIAVLVPAVRLTKRTRVFETVTANLNVVVDAIERNIEANANG